MKPMDQLTPFMFEEHPVRGVIVNLDQVSKTIFTQQAYPPLIQSLLSEAVIAVVMLFSLSKENGKMTLQFQGQGPLKLLSVRCTYDRKLRGLAQWDAEQFNTLNLNQTSWLDLMGHDGHLVMTYQSDTSLDQFQSMIPLTGNSLSDSVENYFTQSDQLKTFIKISSDPKTQTAAGLMLQMMPNSGGTWAEGSHAHSSSPEESFIHLTTLAKTLSDQELLTDTPEKILIKLFHQDPLKVFDPRTLYFGCGCSLEKMQDAVRTLGKSEALKLLEQEGGYLEVKCEFCHHTYSFTQGEVEKLYAAKSSL